MNIKALAGKIGLDYENTLEDFCGDVSALSDKLKRFPKECGIASLEAAIELDDALAIRKAAHAIRKASEKVGLTSLTKAASRVEDAEDEKLNCACQALIEKYNEIQEELSKYTS